MPEFLGNADAFVSSIERDHRLRSTIVTLVLLETRPDWAEVVRRFQLLAQAVPRFRQRMVSSPYPLPPRWESDPDFDLTFHLRRVAAPEPGALDTVLEMARIAAMADFDRARPLWEATLVDGMVDGGAALLLKLHHALSDGIGAVQMAAILFDSNTVSRQPAEMWPPTPSADRGSMALLRDLALDGARSLARSLKMTVDGLMTRPVDTASNALSTVGSLYRAVRPIRKPGSPIMLDRSGIRRLAVSHVSVDKLRRAGGVAGGSLNDAFIAAVAGGLVRYHDKLGAELNDVVVCMPVSVRKPSDPIGGNRATLMRFNAPVAEMDTTERIRLIHARTAKARDEKSLAYTEAIAGALNALPTGYVSTNLRHVDFVASDVPGFTEPLSFAGAAVTMPYAFSPTIGAALNVTLLTYVGECALGINVDTGAITDLGVFYDCLVAGFDDVVALAP